MNQARSTLAFAEFCNGAGLTPQETFVLSERLGWNGDKQILDAIGDKMGLTRERVRQIEAKALRKTRTRFGGDEGSLDDIRDAIDMPEFFFAPLTVITPDTKQQDAYKKRLSKLKKDIGGLIRLKGKLERKIENIGSNTENLAKRLEAKANEALENGTTVQMILVSSLDMEKAPHAFRHFRFKFMPSSAIVPGQGIVVASPANDHGWARIPIHEQVS